MQTAARHGTLLVLVALLASAGCKSLCLHTTARLTNDTSITKDTSALQEMTVVPGGCSGRKIALLDVDGVLLNCNLTGLSSVGENPVEMFREKLDTVARSGCYCAVVLRINSPGGGVTASDIMRRDLAAFKARTGLPVIACLMDVGAGGAYYLASVCDHIVAHPTSLTGGMGVLLNLYDLQDTLQQINVVERVIRSGKYSDLGSPVATMDGQGKEILKRIAYSFHQRFRSEVMAARSLSSSSLEVLDLGPPQPLIPGEVDEDDEDLVEPPQAKPDMFDGRIFTADQAMALRLIDAIGYVDDAIETARHYGGAADARAVILHRWKDPARTPYAITPNVPRSDLLPLSLPGLERTRLPTFLYIWQPDPALERFGGR